MNRRRLSLLVLALLLCHGVPASGGEIRLDSDPSGVLLKIDGPVSLSGSTPLRMDGLPPGNYRLKVSGFGVASSIVKLRRSQPDRLSTDAYSGVGSMLLPPGVAHFGQGDVWRGLTFLGAGAGVATLAVIKEFDRQDAVDNVDKALDAHRRATSVEDAVRSRLDVLAFRDKEKDEEELRAIWGRYLGALWVGAALEAWLLTPVPSLSQTGDGQYGLSVPRAGGFSAGLRSALVPGSGQRALGHGGRGNQFFVVVGVLGAGSIIAHEYFLDARAEQNDFQRRYDAAESEEEIRIRGEALRAAADRADDRSRLRWGLMAVTGAAYLWNIIDAVGLGNESSGERSMGMILKPERDGLSAGLTWRVF